jgi:uncharacterized protein YqeY
MNIKEQIEADIKQAMLAGDKTLVTTLRGLKSSILYAEVAEGSREQGLDEQAVVTLLQKEAKKRQESAELYRQGGNTEKAELEEAERKVIAKYLPAQMDEAELRVIVEQHAEKLGVNSPQQMGQLIGAVKSAVGARADGSAIARLAKEYLSK